MFAGLKQTFRRALQSRGYELYRRPWLPRGVDPWEALRAKFPGWQPRTICDVGANIGEISLRLATYFPSAHIHALEPVRATFTTLAAAVQAEPRIHPHALAASDRNGPAEIMLESASVLNALRPVGDPTPAAPGKVEIVTCTTLDSFCAAQGITHLDLLKTDTEGHELSVLAGAAGLLRAGAIDAILVEAGLMVGNSRFTPLGALAARLQPEGFVLMGIFEQGGLCNRHAAEFCNALFVRAAFLPP